MKGRFATGSQKRRLPDRDCLRAEAQHRTRAACGRAGPSIALSPKARTYVTVRSSSIALLQSVLSAGVASRPKPRCLPFAISAMKRPSWGSCAFMILGVGRAAC